MTRPHPKIVSTTVLAALATIAAAARGKGVDPIVLGGACLTVVQFVVGYLTPSPKPPAPTPKPPTPHPISHPPAPTPKPPKPRPTPHPIRRLLPFDLYDSTEVGELPRGKGSWAVAGYLAGALIPATWPYVYRQYPGHRRFAICVTAGQDGDCLDIEQGDASPQQAAGWWHRQRARGVKRPIFYCNLSTAPTVIDQLARHGIRRKDYRLWVAHYTYRQHVCSRSSCGIDADATQWTDRYAGKNLDASRCKAGFL